MISFSRGSPGEIWRRRDMYGGELRVTTCLCRNRSVCCGQTKEMERSRPGQQLNPNPLVLFPPFLSLRSPPSPSSHPLPRFPSSPPLPPPLPVTTLLCPFSNTTIRCVIITSTSWRRSKPPGRRPSPAPPRPCAERCRPRAPQAPSQTARPPLRSGSRRERTRPSWRRGLSSTGPARRT